MLVDFKDEDFESKVKQEEVSVIQFSAAWCRHKALKPVMDKLSDEYKDKASFITVTLRMVPSTQDLQQEFVAYLLLSFIKKG